MGGHPELGTAVTGAAVEAAVRAEVARYRLPEVHGPVWARRAVVLLRVIAGPAQIVAQQARDEFLPPDRCHGRPADIQLASVVLRGPDDRLSGNIRLKNRRHRLGLAWHAGLAPGELGGVEGRHLYHRHPDMAAIMNQLGAQGIRETANR